MKSEAASSAGFCCELKVVLKQYIKSIEEEERGREEGKGLTSCHLVTTGSLLGSIGLLKVLSILPVCLARRAIHLSSTLIMSQELHRHRKQRHSHEHSTHKPALGQESQANDGIMAIWGE